MAKDFKDCKLMAEYANLLYISRASCTITAINTEYKAAISAVSCGRRREFTPHDQRREHRSPSRQGRSRRKSPRRHKKDREICYYHTIFAKKIQALVAWGREMATPPGI
jgi:hypothetical protein